MSDFGECTQCVPMFIPNMTTLHPGATTVYTDLGLLMAAMRRGQFCEGVFIRV